MEQITLECLSREYLKSYYSVNSYVGCSVNCAYCFLAPIRIVPMRPLRVMGEEALVQAVLLDPLFVPGRTILSLNNRTDPFVEPQVKESTFRLIETFDRAACKNTITITTKGLLTSQDVLRLDSFQHVRIAVIVTFNGLPLSIQPIAQSVQMETMKNVSASERISLIQQFRPIIHGYNDEEKIIKETLTYAKKHCACSVYQGLRISEKISARLERRGYHHVGGYDIHKQKSSETDRIFRQLQAEDPCYRIFDHTSCALSYLLHMPDYNLHYEKRDCVPDCPQYDVCHASEPQPPQDLEASLRRIGITAAARIVGKTLVIDGSLSDGQKSFIKHNYHMSVRAKKRELTFSEAIMEG